MLILRRISRGRLPQNIPSRMYAAEKSGDGSSGKDKEVKKLNEDALKKIQNLLDGLKVVKESSNETSKIFVQATRINKKKAKHLKPQPTFFMDSVIKSVENVAESVGGDKRQTEEELLSKVVNKIIPSPSNLGDVIHGMKVDLKVHEEEERTKHQLIESIRSKREEKKALGTRFTRNKKSLTQSSIDIFNAEPLNLFKPVIKSDGNQTKLNVWNTLEERELKLAMAQPPANYFEKMIMWTDQGKVWTFPINNEQGLEDEHDVPFSEHVFIEAHLEGWCPKKGPIRHFMELVCVGLSKNPYYTAQEKKDHILWFKEYFESKTDMLKEVGALD